jgi:hypothetical protein
MASGASCGVSRISVGESKRPPRGCEGRSSRKGLCLIRRASRSPWHG